MRALSSLVFLPLVTAWQLSVLHVNDIHARMEETNKYSGPCTREDVDAEKCYGGLGRLTTAVKRMKKQDEVRLEKGRLSQLYLRGATAWSGSVEATFSRARCGTLSSNGEWLPR